MEAARVVDGRISVFCRFRPFTSDQQSLGKHSVFRQLNKTTVEVASLKEGETVNYSFDSVFGLEATQQEVYELTTQAIVSKAFSGYNGTVMAYGQTNSGKTHTMQGPPSPDPNTEGIMPRAMRHLFRLIDSSPEHIKVQIRVSMVELYMEKIRDLLYYTQKELKIRQHIETGFFIENLRDFSIKNEQEFASLLQRGDKNRVKSATNMNKKSSRSHLILIVSIRQENTENNSIRTGKLYLVDLAGSQKIGKSGVQGIGLQQTNKINLSLSVLSKVIKTLSKGTHVPYRECKLTQILQESLGGNSLTSLIITCSPHKVNLPETLSTLRFGDSTSKIRNRPKQNKEMDAKDLQLLLDRVTKENDEKAQRIIMLEEIIKNRGVVPSLARKSSKTETEYKLKRRLTDFLTPTDRSPDSSILDGDFYSDHNTEISIDVDRSIYFLKEKDELEEKCKELIHRNNVLEDQNRQLQLQNEENTEKNHGHISLKRRATEYRSCAGRVTTPRFGLGFNGEQNLLDFTDVPYFKSRREVQGQQHHLSPRQPISHTPLPSITDLPEPSTFRLQASDIVLTTTSKPKPHPQEFTDEKQITVKKFSCQQPQTQTAGRRLNFDTSKEPPINNKMSFDQCAESFMGRLEKYHSLATNLFTDVAKSREKRMSIMKRFRESRGESVGNA